jgi:hypothetical protein
VVRISEPQADTSTAGVNMAERMVRVLARVATGQWLRE